jgi:anhydro-N-acetylmuramic acid kinase
VIAQRTGISVVADFRTADLAAGGEGAPLVPFFDKYFFGQGPARAMQNVGGIGNVTLVGRGLPTVAFDTGPGNCLIDIAAHIASRGRLRYDQHGWLALRGCVDHRSVERLWRHAYFRRPPPKSTGRELFNEELLRSTFGARLRRQPLDVLATLTYFSAFSIAESYRRFLPRSLREVVVSGGGMHNRTLLGHLSRLLSPTPVRPITRYGLPAQAKEPAAFAFLGLRALHGRVNHLPSTTGAAQACLLGSVTHALD